MINIIIIKEKQNIKTIEATGHAGYAEQGRDIVCSAVSTIMETMANGIIEVVKAKAKVEVDENMPKLHITLLEEDAEKHKSCQVLMKSAVLGLKSLALDYGKYIKIKEKQND